MSLIRPLAILCLLLVSACAHHTDRSKPRIRVEPLNPWTHLTW